MEYRRLGGSGTQVSEIALGNWVTHGGQVGEDAARACVTAALDAGINFFDTADVYERGAAEEVLGSILQDVPRHTYVLATKLYWPMSRDLNDRGLSRKHMMESIDRSLARLETDYVDLYQAHRYDENVPLHETMRAFDDLVRSGKVLYVGVSEWNASQIKKALEIADDMGFDRLVTNQPQYSMLWRVPEPEIMPLCRKEDVGQIVWSPLAMGVLTGKYEPGKPLPEGSRGAYGQGVRSQYLEQRTLEAVQQLRSLAADANLTMAQLALAWVLQNDNVSAAIVGASRPEQVEDNVGASGVHLSDDIMERIDEILAGCVVSDPSLTG